MFNKICAMGVSLLVAGGTLALSGCGSSSGSSSHGGAPSAAAPHTTTLPGGQTLVEAAERTDQASGYRIHASMKVTLGSTTVPITMSGVVEDHGSTAALTSQETVQGHQVDLQLRLGDGNYYMSGVPGLSTLSHGKHWLSFNLAQAQQAEGLGGLQNPTSSNPAEFLKYLRTVGSDVTPVGTTTIDGQPTTEYRAMIDFDHYTRLVPAAQRSAARQTIAALEKAIGRHSLPVTVWVGADHEVRRMHLQIPECVDGQHLSMSMTIDLSDYGNVPAVSVPSASDAYDITPMLKSKLPDLKTQNTGCAATTTG